MSDLVERLRGLADAYPEDIFPALTKAQIDADPSLVTRASAQMGRHFSRLFTQCADAIESATKDARRYRWLRNHTGMVFNLRGELCLAQYQKDEGDKAATDAAIDAAMETPHD